MNIIRLYEDVFRLIEEKEDIPLCPSRPLYEEMSASIAVDEVFSCNQFASCRKGTVPAYYIDASMPAGLCKHANDSDKLADVPFWCRSCPAAHNRFRIISETVPDIISTARNAVIAVDEYNKNSSSYSRHVILENFWSDGSIAVKPIGRLPLGRKARMKIIQNLRTSLSNITSKNAEVFFGDRWPNRAVPMGNPIPDEIQTVVDKYNTKVPEENRFQIVSYSEGKVFIAINEKHSRLWTINKDLRIRRAFEILFSHCAGKPSTVVLLNQ